MKILIDARESGTTSGRYVDKLVEYLHKLQPEHEIVVATTSHRVEFMKQIAPNFEVLTADYKEFTFNEQFGFNRFLKKQKADLVHFSMVQQPVLYRRKKVTTMNDLTTLRFTNPSKNLVVFKVKQKIYGWLNKKVARSSSHIITFTEFVKKDIHNYTKIPRSKITPIWLAADEIKENSKPIKNLLGKQFILYVGRPQPHKNLDRLVESFKLLKQENPDLRLVLAGKKDELYERILRRLKQQDVSGVVVTGFVSEGELKWLYRNCQAYVFPSLSEGFGLPGLEAMVHGAPVVSSSATCLPELYGQAAHYFNPYSVDDMATKINEVLNDKNLRRKLIENGERQIKNFSWEVTAKKTLEIYNKVLKG